MATSLSRLLTWQSFRHFFTHEIGATTVSPPIGCLSLHTTMPLTHALVFAPWNRMPLNPNGKIDKPALAFPDTTQSATAAPATGKAASTEEKMHQLWSKILSNAPHSLPLKESFFDLSEHSILASHLRVSQNLCSRRARSTDL